MLPMRRITGQSFLMQFSSVKHVKLGAKAGPVEYPVLRMGLSRADIGPAPWDVRSLFAGWPMQVVPSGERELQ